MTNEENIIIIREDLVKHLLDSIDSLDLGDLQNAYIDNNNGSNRSVRMIRRKCKPLHDPKKCLQLHSSRNNQFYVSLDLHNIRLYYPEYILFDGKKKKQRQTNWFIQLIVFMINLLPIFVFLILFKHNFNFNFNFSKEEEGEENGMCYLHESFGRV